MAAGTRGHIELQIFASENETPPNVRNAHASVTKLVTGQARPVRQHAPARVARRRTLRSLARGCDARGSGKLYAIYCSHV